jgi:hypothetical protein
VAKLYTVENKLLTVGGRLAIDARCCCGEPPNAGQCGAWCYSDQSRIRLRWAIEGFEPGWNSDQQECECLLIPTSGDVEVPFFDASILAFRWFLDLPETEVTCIDPVLGPRRQYLRIAVSKICRTDEGGNVAGDWDVRLLSVFPDSGFTASGGMQSVRFAGSASCVSLTDIAASTDGICQNVAGAPPFAKFTSIQIDVLNNPFCYDPETESCIRGPQDCESGECQT